MPTNPRHFPSMAGTSAPLLCLRILAFNMAKIDAVGRFFFPQNHLTLAVGVAAGSITPLGVESFGQSLDGHSQSDHLSKDSSLSLL
jgi:hypothetical protein